MFRRNVSLMSITGLVVLGLSLPASAQTAEDAAAACSEASRLIAEDDIAGALDEAQWCVESLQQIKQNQTLTLFPDSVDGFTGGEVDNQSAMGMTIIEREYERDGQSLSVSFTGGIAGGGLAALAQLASGFGAAGGTKMRVQKRTVIDMSAQSGQAEYLVQMKSGGMLNFSSSSLDSDTVLAFVKAFPIAEIDDSMSE